MPTKKIYSSEIGGYITVPLKNTDAWYLTALGCGVIAYRPDRGGFYVLLASRTAQVGEGLGITGGGFAKIEDILQEDIPVGKIIQGYEEAYQEACEENKGFEDVVSFEFFEERAQCIASFLVRTSDENQSHACMQYALRITNPQMWNDLKALPPGDDGERTGDLIEAFVSYDSIVSRTRPQDSIRITADKSELFPNSAPDQARFYHPHEPHAIGAIAWHDKRDNLWRN